MKIEQQSFITDKENKHTETKYKTAFNNFNKFIEEKQITEIDNKEILRQYKQQLKANTKLSNNTKNQYIILIKNFLKNECGIKIKDVEQLKTQKPTPHYISKAEYNIILEYLDEQLTTATPRKRRMIRTNQTIIKLIFNTGLRIHEVLKLKIQDITNLECDHNNYYPMDIIGKGNKDRRIIIEAPLYEALTEYINEYNNNIYVFESSRNQDKPLTRQIIERQFQQIAQQLDQKYNNKYNFQDNLKPHNLRHSYAIIAAGIYGLNYVQDVLGHSNITTTQIYLALDKKDLSDMHAAAKNQAEHLANT